VTPTQDHALVQLPTGTGTRRFTTLAGNLIDVTFDKSITPEDNLYGTLQVLKKAPQLLAKMAEGFGLLFFPILHVIYIYSIQIKKSQDP